jgi:hypothetical protein
MWNLKAYLILADTYPKARSGDCISDEEIERDKHIDFSKWTLWELICLDAIDTEHSHIYYTKAYLEALSRGLSASEYKRARKFMWLTAGWLNFELMMWDWVHLDENDIIKAINLQHEKGFINAKKKQTMLDYVEKIKHLDKRGLRQTDC